jgi:hypothetical protein
MRTTSGLPVEAIGSSMDRNLTALVTGALSILLLGTWLISTPMDARAEEVGRVKTSGYPDVEDVPPRPDKPAMTVEEQLKLKKELGAARDRQALKAKSSSPGASSPGAAKP